MSEAARLVIEQRLRAVADCLSRLRDELAHSGEGVHQLRVASRRASAALLVFQPFVEPRAWRKARRRLRRMRRAAGEARACDVQLGLLDGFRDEATDVEHKAIEHLTRRIRKTRWRARRRVIRVLDRFPAGRLRRWTENLGRAFRAEVAADWVSVAGTSERNDVDRLTTLQDVARVLLQRVLQPIARSPQPLSSDMDTLHDLRLAAKRLRYSCEVFRRCFGSDRWKDAQAQTVSVQDRLGEINDLSDMAEFVQAAIVSREAKRASDSSDDIFDGLLRIHTRIKAGFEGHADAFCRWWDEGGRESLLEAYRSLLNPSQTDQPTVVTVRSNAVNGRPAMAMNGDERPCA